MRMAIKEKLLNLSKYAIIPSFLGLEVIAFIAFSFGGSFVLYASLSLALLILLILFNAVKVSRDGASNLLLLAIPLLMFALLTALSSYTKNHTVYLNDFSNAERIFLPIGIFSIGLCGYLMAYNQSFKLKTFLLVLFSALAILVVINLFINLINFGAFYTLKYKGYYMYYAGKRSSSPVNEFAYALERFQFIEVKMGHYVLYPTLLLSSSIMLFKLSPKSNKKMFIIYCAFSLIGLLALGLIPSRIGLFSIIFIILVDGITLLYERIPDSRKPLKIAMIVIIVIGVITFFITLLNNQSFASGISNMIKNNSLLNKIFNNGRVSSFNKTLTNILGNNFFGFSHIAVSSVIAEEVHLSGSFLFDSFMTSGVIGAACLFFICIYGLKSFKTFIIHDEESLGNKETLLAFILVFFGYSALFNNGEYGIYYSIIRPIYMTGPFMICLFIFYYVIAKKFMLGGKKNEEVTA